MSGKVSVNSHMGDAEHLKVLGYDDSFKRNMSFWATFALGFTYLSPLVGVYSLFAVALTTGGPPSIFWIVIVGAGQLLVSLVFGEVVSQYPIAGGIYPWTRRLWGKRYAWMAAWIYIWAMIVTITAVADYGSFFLSSLLSIDVTKESEFILTLVLLAVALFLNFAGTKTMARVARIGLAAELAGVVLLGLYLLIFQRQNEWSVFFDTMGTGADNYTAAFIGAAIAGLFLFYGFEACGDVAEEVQDPARGIPRAMYLTILIGGVSALLSFGGYVMAAPDLAGIISGENGDPIPGILEASLGTVGAKIFLVVAVMAFLSCVLSLQAAASRLLFSFSRDEMLPAHKWMSKLSPRTHVPTNALLVSSVIPALIALIVYAGPEGVLLKVTAFAIIGIYISFQAVVLAALRKRFQGWQPAGPFSLGRVGGWVVNVGALAWGVFAIILLATPGSSGDFVTDYIVWIGLGIVVIVGALYLFIARPGRGSTAAENDAMEVAEKLRAHRG